MSILPLLMIRISDAASLLLLYYALPVLCWCVSNM